MAWPLLPMLAIAATATPPSTLPAARAQAQASVRIVSGARVTFGQSADAGPYWVVKASVRVEDGSRRPAQLVEFQ